MNIPVSIKVNGRKLPADSGFPYRYYAQTLELSPEDAEEIVDMIRAKAKAARKQTETKESTEPPPF